jgi:copper chaperone CopZ
MGLALGVVLVSGCSRCDVPVQHVDRAGAMEETVAQLAISGMMCEIACVSKVRKELYDLPGVTRADIQFDADRKVDTALVVFDPKVVSPETLIATVEEIGDGLYDVETAEVVHYAPESSR